MRVVFSVNELSCPDELQMLNLTQFICRLPLTLRSQRLDKEGKGEKKGTDMTIFCCSWLPEMLDLTVAPRKELQFWAGMGNCWCLCPRKLIVQFANSVVWVCAQLQNNIKLRTTLLSVTHPLTLLYQMLLHPNLLVDDKSVHANQLALAFLSPLFPLCLN